MPARVGHSPACLQSRGAHVDTIIELYAVLCLCSEVLAASATRSLGRARKLGQLAWRSFVSAVSCHCTPHLGCSRVTPSRSVVSTDAFQLAPVVGRHATISTPFSLASYGVEGLRRVRQQLQIAGATVSIPLACCACIILAPCFGTGCSVTCGQTRKSPARPIGTPILVPRPNRESRIPCFPAKSGIADFLPDSQQKKHRGPERELGVSACGQPAEGGKPEPTLPRRFELPGLKKHHSLPSPRRGRPAQSTMKTSDTTRLCHQQPELKCKTTSQLSKIRKSPPCQ